MTRPLPAPPEGWRCRWCRSTRGSIVLDLGDQPAADYFPMAAEPGPDPAYPLSMAMCGGCQLAQLTRDDTNSQEPRGVEPRALVDQAEAAAADLAKAGYVRRGRTVTEFGSPHGGSWLPILTEHGMRPTDTGTADVVVDSLGLMHERDQYLGLQARLLRLAPTGTLVVHFHSLATIVRDGTWNALRHGHFAYYSLPVLIGMARQAGLAAKAAWRYPLYGGTVVVAFRRCVGGEELPPDVAELASHERSAGVLRAWDVSRLAGSVTRSVSALKDYLVQSRGLKVCGYGAASRAVALLTIASVGVAECMVIGDASAAKWGRALPGSRIPVVPPDELVRMRPDRILLFVPDLLAEVRTSLPALERAGARWVVVEPLPVDVPPADGPRFDDTP